MLGALVTAERRFLYDAKAIEYNPDDTFMVRVGATNTRASNDLGAFSTRQVSKLSVNSIIRWQMVLWATEAVLVKPVRLEVRFPRFIVIDLGRRIRTATRDIREFGSLENLTAINERLVPVEGQSLPPPAISSWASL